MTQKLVAFKLDKSLLHQMDEYCRTSGGNCSRSSFIRKCIFHYLGMTDLEVMAVERAAFKQTKFPAPPHYQTKPLLETVTAPNNLSDDLEHLRRYDPSFVQWIMNSGQNSEAVKMLVAQRMQQYPRGI